MSDAFSYLTFLCWFTGLVKIIQSPILYVKVVKDRKYGIVLGVKKPSKSISCCIFDVSSWLFTMLL